MMADPGAKQDNASASAAQVGRLLGEALRSLRFYAEAGYSGGYCRRENMERLACWRTADCLRPAGKPVTTAGTLSACAGCPLRGGELRAINGVGPASARLMFVLGYPSFSTDREGNPYAGEAGNLLLRIISAMKLSPEDVYVTHAVKCRPPDGRPPSAEETRFCLSLLNQELDGLAPVVVCALGEFAAQTLLNSQEPLAGLRGHFYDRAGIRVLPTWHPVYDRAGIRVLPTWHPDDMIEDPLKKRPAWDDIRLVMQCLDIS